MQVMLALHYPKTANRPPGKLRPVLLSDQDIVAAVDSGRLGIEPYSPELVQPSSIDVRMDKFFRVFNNSRYTHIEPK